jgi:hypothetical protein
LTPDLLAETGYRYTAAGATTTSRPNSHAPGKRSIPSAGTEHFPMIVARQMDASDFADMIVDNFDEMLKQSEDQPLVFDRAASLPGRSPAPAPPSPRPAAHQKEAEESLVYDAGRDLRPRRKSAISFFGSPVRRPWRIRRC